MIRILLTKYWVLAHLLLVAGTLCFVPNLSAWFALWAAGSLLLFARFLPPVLKGEGFWAARTRVDRAMGGDILTWSGILAVLYVGIALFNGPRDFVLDLSSFNVLDLSAKPKWRFTDPPMAFAPSAVNPAEGVPLFVGLLCGVACALAVRVALPRSQRLLALVGVGLLTGLLALVAMLAPGLTEGLAWLGGAEGAATLWLLLFCVCLGVTGEAFLRHRGRLCAVALVAACLNSLGLFAFGGTLAIMLAGMVTVLWFVCAGFAARVSGRKVAVLWGGALGVPLVLAALVGFCLAPGGRDFGALFGHEPLSAAWETFSTQWNFRQALAFDVLDLNPMLGVGPNGLAYFAEQVLDPADISGWELWKTGGTALPCDFTRLLMERGLLGAILILLPGIALLGRCAVRGVALARLRSRRLDYRYSFVFVGSLLGVVSMLVFSVIGAPLHAPAPLCAFLIVCACLAGWLPRPR